jgi:hypothetical protein
MGSPVETTEEDFHESADLPSWALELGERPVPLREAARLAGISLATAKRRIVERPALVLSRKGGERGRPAPFALPSSLLPKEKAPDAKASSYFAHRCRLAGVNPSQTLWRIVTGALPDADKLIDAMRYAMDAKVEQGTPLFLKWVGGVAPLPDTEPRTFHHWLARHVLRNCSRKVPRGTFEALWKRSLRKVEKEGKLLRHFVPQKADGKWRLAESPDYWRALKRVPGYAGEVRVLDRAVRKLKAVEALGELLIASGSGSREANLASAAKRAMLKAKPAPRFPAFEQARGRTIKDGASLKEREELDFHGSVGGFPSLGADAQAEEALTLMMAAGLSPSRARTLLRAYWVRGKNPFNSKLSASSVRQIFGMSSRARTGKRPERRRKTRASGRKRNVPRSRLLSGR